MIRVSGLREGKKLFKALGSDIRIAILELLLEDDNMNLNDLATALNLTNGALTSHIRQLEEAGMIAVNTKNSAGNEKKYCVTAERILVQIRKERESSNHYETDIKVGSYSDYMVAPSCGLSTATHYIGQVDDPRYFSHPDRAECEILWFTEGYVEYILPNLLPPNQKADQITISAELCSEAPGSNNQWPSDIHFYLNGVLLGAWTSPGDFGDIKGRFTPEWWNANMNQYGLLKSVTVNHDGSFIDGIKMSDTTIDRLELHQNSPVRFRFAVPAEAEHVGGLTIFGKSFGNYNQDIKVRVEYSPKEKSSRNPGKLL
ncbi:winged helix-turn-helix transcriptional regulator [Clostridium sp. MCC353]|uniref:ArsR/SmtB family transcription factor n=1 Tax=Clostridium sp. MCC353 TaxID=2592646 RepID=UPI001C015CC9|nr:winged helix-turn-helix transcriptional regulator [Clostridium sp. MCC353]MBT9778305.1 winged helix-turn-helix transcriptional regulator [Clostridium sp. MCC353]